MEFLNKKFIISPAGPSQLVYLEFVMRKKRNPGLLPKEADISVIVSASSEMIYDREMFSKVYSSL